MTPSIMDVRQVWRTLSPEQQEEIGVAALVHAIGAAGVFAGLEPVQGFAAADLEGERALGEAAEAALGPVAALPRPDLTVIGIRACRVCGCSTDYGCPEGCSWVQPDLCSSCLSIS